MATDEDSRTVVPLSPEAEEGARRLSAAMGDVSLGEVVRRGLLLLDLYVTLPAGEELVLYRNTGQIDRIQFTWEA